MPDPIAPLSALQGLRTRLADDVSNAGPLNASTALGTTPPPSGVNPLESVNQPGKILSEDSTLAIGSVDESGAFAGPTSAAPAFGDALKNYMGKVNSAQLKGEEVTESLALGEPIDVHKVMLTLGEASNAMALTLQVRSHVLKAYQDLMQLPL
jgi:flagellar hook-basal body complex protein FliE